MTSPSLSEERGFAFITVVLILFLAVLAAAVIFLLTTSTQSSAKLKVTNEKARLMRVALANYKINHGGASLGTFPLTLTYLLTTDSLPCVMDNVAASVTYLTLQGWCGPYVDQVFTALPNDYQTDGWGTNFQYIPLTGVLTSCGPDLTCGTSDDLTY